MLPLFLISLQDVPVNFAPTSEIAMFRRDSGALDAPNWMVTLRGDRLRVETRVTWVKRTNAEYTPRLGGGSQKVKLSNATVTWTPGGGAAVEDGWIDGFDAGEFGGGLYWFSKNGTKRIKLSDDNTQMVIRTREGVFAIQSLDHLKFWYGRLVKVAKEEAGWKLRRVTDLHLSPHAIVRDGERFVYSTPEFVTTLETDGTQREIYRGLGELRTVSMVRRSNGEIWIGASQGILRLAPKRGGDYTAQWFLPKP